MLGPAVRAGAGPLDFASGVGLLFPDGDTGLDLIDEVAVRIEGSFTVRAGGEDDDSGFSDGEGADTVDGEGVGDGEFFEGLGEDFLAFLIGEDGVSFVMEQGDFTALVVVPHEALKGDDSTASGIGEVCAESGEVERGGLNLEHGAAEDRKNLCKKFSGSGYLASSERGHKGDSVGFFKRSLPISELVIDRGLDMREV